MKILNRVPGLGWQKESAGINKNRNAVILNMKKVFYEYFRTCNKRVVRIKRPCWPFLRACPSFAKGKGKAFEEGKLTLRDVQNLAVAMTNPET